MDHVEGQDRHQMMMYSLDQLVHPQAFVRMIDTIVDSLDLSSFEFSYFNLKPEGRPPYHPATFLKLYLYGYQNGIRSCRKLEHACKINVEVMWLLKGLTPHYKTVANLRKDNAKSFRMVFRHFVFILKDWKLVEKCKLCPIKDQCTSSSNGRVIQRTEHQSAIDRNNNRVNKNPAYYKFRQQIIEHQFGTFKRQWHFDHVFTKGKQNVIGEISSLFTAYNLRRSMSILGFKGLMN